MRRILMAVAVMTVLAGSAQAADPLKKLAGKLEKGLKGEPARKVAVLSFPNTDGGASEGSKIIQERLTTFLAEGGEVQVIERQLLQKILDEKKLAQTGLLDAKTSQEIGKILGVNALVTGTLNEVGGGRIEINARAIEADTGRILSAGQAQIAATWKPGVTQLADDPKPARGKHLAQIAILLDTSNSMDGLIQQAKTQLWRIVNEIASSKKDGRSPELQVAVYHYGNSSISMRDHYVQQVVGFTSDLDRVSEALFGLRTNGGDEYTGAAVQDAVARLSWSSEPGAYKAIFVAGNEPFTQGPVPFREAIAAAVRKGVVVNTVFCGNRQEGANTDWLAGAQAGGGEYLVIDQDNQVAMMRTPHDDEITRLSLELNKTFVPMGAGGRAAAANQARQDANAMAAAPAAAAERAAFKAKAQYKSAASAWDAVTMLASGASVRGMEKDEMPAEMQAMSEEGRVSYLKDKAEDRKKIEGKIQKLQAEREKYVKEQEKKAGSSLGSAVVDAVRKQAAKKGYNFKS